MTPESTGRQRPARAPFSLRNAWHDVNTRAWIYQVLVVAGILGLAAYLIANAQHALAKQGISTGFSFLDARAGFEIGEKSIAFSSTDSFLRAYGVAILNTLKVSGASILLATVVGVVVGLGRLSTNPLMRKLASIYVEVFRNTPQLIQLVFWYTLIANLPRPREALSLGGAVFLSNRGLAVPWLADHAAPWILAAVVLAAFAAGGAARAVLARLARRHGRPWPGAALGSLAAAALPLAAGVALLWPLEITTPALRGFNFQGGLTLSPEFVALLLGLSLYIAAFIAEIVRSGVQSVGRGQIEAAHAVGLGRSDLYLKIIFPQALRVMVPPAAGQYVSIIKNSSLGVAIGYPELFNVNNTIVTLSGHTVEAIAIMMSIYLAISFVIAALMNLYNRCVQIRER